LGTRTHAVVGGRTLLVSVRHRPALKWIVHEDTVAASVRTPQLPPSPPVPLPTFSSHTHQRPPTGHSVLLDLPDVEDDDDDDDDGDAVGPTTLSGSDYILMNNECVHAHPHSERDTERERDHKHTHIVRAYTHKQTNKQTSTQLSYALIGPSSHRWSSSSTRPVAVPGPARPMPAVGGQAVSLPTTVPLATPPRATAPAPASTATPGSIGGGASPVTPLAGGTAASPPSSDPRRSGRPVIVRPFLENDVPPRSVGSSSTAGMGAAVTLMPGVAGSPPGAGAHAMAVRALAEGDATRRRLASISGLGAGTEPATPLSTPTVLSPLQLAAHAGAATLAARPATGAAGGERRGSITAHAEPVSDGPRRRTSSFTRRMAADAPTAPLPDIGVGGSSLVRYLCVSVSVCVSVCAKALTPLGHRARRSRTLPCSTSSCAVKWRPAAAVSTVARAAQVPVMLPRPASAPRPSWPASATARHPPCAAPASARLRPCPRPSRSLAVLPAAAGVRRPRYALC
jgi:hypothetical protein